MKCETVDLGGGEPVWVKDAQEYGWLLRASRQQAGKNLGEAARHLGCSITALCDIEVGKAAPLVSESLSKLSLFLNRSPTWVKALEEAAKAWTPPPPVDPSSIRGFFDARCKRCWARYGWGGGIADKPATCPKGHPT